MVSFSSALETILHQAKEYAVDRQHPVISQDHLLLALMGDDHIKHVLQDCGLKTDLFALSLTDYIDAIPPFEHNINTVEPAPSEAVALIVRRAIHMAEQQKAQKVLPIQVLLALLREPDSHGVNMLSLTISSRPRMEQMASLTVLERFICDRDTELKRPVLLRKIGKYLPSKKWFLKSPRFAAPLTFPE